MTLTQPVPMSEVQMAVPIDSLAKLPPMASYSVRSGQANARVSREDGNLIVYASCDSLEQLVTYYEEACESYMRRNDSLEQEYRNLEQTSSERHSNAIKMLMPTFLFGLVIGFILGIIVIIRKQK